MIGFVIFLMEAFVMWRLVLYAWCDNCGKNVRNGRSQLCARCQASTDLALEKLLNK